MEKIRFSCENCGKNWDPFHGGNVICPNCDSINTKIVIFDEYRNYESTFFNDSILDERKRVETYYKNFFEVLILSIIACIFFLFKIPLSMVSWHKYLLLFFLSRIADILTTLIGLQMPWTIETNPIAGPTSLNRYFWHAQIKAIWSIIWSSSILYLLVPNIGISVLLIFTLIGFIAAINNILCAFFLLPSNIISNIFISSTVSFVFFNILKNLTT